MSQLIDLTGKRFGRLTVIGRVENHGERAFWKCRCDCGNEKEIAGQALRYGRTKSRGCIAKELITERNTKHGFAKRNHQERLYKIWKSMIGRCDNPSSCGYANYGGRGISVCEDWYDYKNFREWAYNNGYSDELSIDRIDVNGNYEPDNCRWATHYIQSNNTRRNILVTLGEVTHSLKEWCDEFNLKYGTVKNRVRNGLDVYSALFLPLRT